jgi:pSer/pThr/pTyr-binding forkhead associated (FHA) protein
MPILTLYADKKKIKTYEVQPDQSLSIGRLERNAIVLDDPAVSSFHAEIESDGAQYFITDYQSRNGTFVNKELVISRKLAHGDRITINPFTLVFDYRGGEKVSESDAQMMQATMHIDTSDHRSRLARSLSEMAGKSRDRQKLGCLEFLRGDRPPHFLTQPITRIGKSETCEVVVKGWMVGQVAAEIRLENSGYILKHVGGARKPRVNYQAISDEAVLSEFDILEIGPTAMQLHYRRRESAAGGQRTEEIELGALEAAEDEGPEEKGA